MNKVILITGASRGMGVDICRAALAAGHRVVATGRNPEAVERAVGAHENLMVTRLDVTKPVDAEATVTAAVKRFDRIDVLINNAANFQAGWRKSRSSYPSLGRATSIISTRTWRRVSSS